jgi:hypothetical protein
MPPKNEPTPIVEPIQGQGTRPSPSQQPIHPSPIVDEGPSDSTIPPNQRSSDTQRPGTQDALRGQGNSATSTTFSREDFAPAASEQQKQDSEYKKAETQHRLGGPGGDDDFRQTGAKSGQGEPTPGKVRSSASPSLLSGSLSYDQNDGKETLALRDARRASPSNSAKEI